MWQTWLYFLRALPSLPLSAPISWTAESERPIFSPHLQTKTLSPDYLKNRPGNEMLLSSPRAVV